MLSNNINTNNGKLQKQETNDQMEENNLEETSQQIGQFQKEKAETSHEFFKEDEESTDGQIDWPNHEQMKIQLAKETWFDLLPFVPRHQLGDIAPQVGNRRFAAIIQSFLHNYRDIILGNVWICRPDPENVNHGPDLRSYPKSTVWYHRGRHQNLVLPNVEMPENIKDFLMIRLSYLDTSVLNFLKKFQQNSFFGNINLDIQLDMSSQERLTLLSYVLPLINNINSIHAEFIYTMFPMYNSRSALAMDVLEMARILAILICCYQFGPKETDVLNRWLYTARADGRPRVLILPPETSFNSVPNALNFINGSIKLEFSKAKIPVSFFIRIFLRNDVEWQDICMENGETKEKLVIKNVDSHKMAMKKYLIKQKMVLISRYPSNAGKKWIEENEKEAVEWEFDAQNSRIILDNPVQNAIPWNYEHSDTAGRETHYQSHRKNHHPNSNAKDRQDSGSGR